MTPFVDDNYLYFTKRMADKTQLLILLAAPLQDELSTQPTFCYWFTIVLLVFINLPNDIPIRSFLLFDTYVGFMKNFTIVLK